MKEHGTGLDIAMKIVAVLVAGLFFVAGGAKIGGWLDPQFVAWGYSRGFAVLIGVFEVVFAVALLIERATAWGAFGLMFIMLGALGTHLVHGEYTMSSGPIVVFALLGFLAWGRGPTRGSVRQLERASTRRTMPSRV